MEEQLATTQFIMRQKIENWKRRAENGDQRILNSIRYLSMTSPRSFFGSYTCLISLLFLRWCWLE